MGSVKELASIEAKTIILPGTDPQHPVEVAELYARYLRHPVMINQTAPDCLQELFESTR
jgi:hypothetical protein